MNVKLLFRIILGIIICIYFILLLFSERNLFKVFGVGIMILGFLMNILTIIINGGKMPVRTMKKYSTIHKPMTKKSKFKILADIFVIKIKGKKHTNNIAFSIGDILLFLGVIISII